MTGPRGSSTVPEHGQIGGLSRQALDALWVRERARVVAFVDGQERPEIHLAHKRVGLADAIAQLKEFLARRRRDGQRDREIELLQFGQPPGVGELLVEADPHRLRQRGGLRCAAERVGAPGPEPPPGPKLGERGVDPEAGACNHQRAARRAASGESGVQGAIVVVYSYDDCSTGRPRNPPVHGRGTMREMTR